MTASWAGTPPVVPAAGGPSPLVVSTVRADVHRRFRFVIGIQVACVALVVAALLVLAHIAEGALGALALTPFLIVLLGVGFQIGCGATCSAPGRRSTPRSP